MERHEMSNNHPTPARTSAPPGGRVHAALLFDARVLPWCLTDKELERVHFNGVQEINRRGIQRWK